MSKLLEALEECEKKLKDGIEKELDVNIEFCREKFFSAIAEVKNPTFNIVIFFRYKNIKNENYVLGDYFPTHELELLDKNFLRDTINNFISATRFKFGNRFDRNNKDKIKLKMEIDNISSKINFLYIKRKELFKKLNEL